MKLVVGLGNPGEHYAGTRHNAGFMLLDRLVEQAQNSRLRRGYGGQAKRKVPALPYVSQGRQNFSLELKTSDWQVSQTGRLEYLWMEFGDESVELVKPLTFMNNSGRALAYVFRKHPRLSMYRTYVVHDDLDIPLGKYKIQIGKGPRQHGGLTSIYQSIGTNEFWHVRIGIENRSLQAQSFLQQSSGRAKLKAQSRIVSGEEYVLQRFAESEREVVDRLLDVVLAELLGRLRDRH